jgi:hypothetical protein
MKLVPLLASIVAGAPAAAPAAAQGTCPSAGLMLGTAGGRRGDKATVSFQGTPSAGGLLGVDLGPGPTVTPFGTVCLALSPSLFTLPIALDGAGNGAVVFPPQLSPSLAGVTAFVQAFVVDGTPPFGLAFSNSDAIGLYLPRAYFLSQGAIPTGSPGTLVLHDALGDLTGAAIPLAGPVSDVLYDADYACNVVLTSSGTATCYDGQTGSALVSIALPTTPTAPFRLASAHVPGLVLALHHGIPPSPFSAGAPGAVTTFTAGGALGLHFPLSAARPDDLLVVPGSHTAYLIAGSDVVGVDYVLGVETSTTSLPAINGPVVDHLLHGPLLLTLHDDGSIFGIDVATGAPAPGFPVVVPTAGGSVARRLRAGPAAGVDALAVLFPDSAELVFLSASTYQLLGAVPLPAGTSMIELSPGGTEWLLVQPGFGGGPFGGTPVPGALLAVDAATLAATAVAALPSQAQTSLTPLPSDALRKAYVTSPNAAFYLFPTDPAGAGMELPLPVSAQRVVTN